MSGGDDPAASPQPSNGSRPFHPADLHGRVALVTGASRGVGRGIARGLGEAGATVYVTGRTVTEGTSAARLPGTVHATAADGTEFNPGPFWQQPLELWDSMHRIGVRAHYVTTALAAPLMIETGPGLVV